MMVSACLLASCASNDQIKNEVIAVSERDDRWSNLHKAWTGSCKEAGLPSQETCGRVEYRDSDGIMQVIGVTLNSECFNTVRVGYELPDTCLVH